MKKSLLLVVILLAFNSLFANPVDVNRAKELGQKFVGANFEQKSNNLELVYTAYSESGEACFYVFNTDNGFVMISADDCARPILGYSEEGAFDINNIAPGLTFMMDEYKNAIIYAVDNNIAATSSIISEWKSIEISGSLNPDVKLEPIGPLCTTKWNQSWPYNKFCPEQPASWASNGHAVVGCVATAMAQIMAYWDHPTQGTGSHTYQPVCGDYEHSCYGQPSYPQQTVNFGATTYDWENMADVIDSSSPVEEIDAVATLSYHCGVAVDMMYDHHGSGSGSYSEKVPLAIQSYFSYAPSEVSTLGSWTYYQDWIDKLTEAIRMRRPVYYGGCAETGCHAFVCDGIDANGLFHFNYGWGGSSDGYFAPNAIEYAYDVANIKAIFNMMPMSVYQSTANAPTNMTVVPADNNELSATISWVNPSKSLNGANLSSIDKIVIERNGLVIQEIENPSIGESMTFVDNAVPCFSHFDYAIYAVVNGSMGKIATVNDVPFGPTCTWTMILKSSVFQGMRGAKVAIYDAAGVCVDERTTNNSTQNVLDIEVPLGKVRFDWVPQTSGDPYDITIIIKDANNQTVYNYTGSTSELKAGTLLTIDNNCGDSSICDAPTNLEYSYNEDNKLVLSWNGAGNPKYGYNIYRDGILIALTTETTFTDVYKPKGGHCYTVTALCENGNSSESNEICAVLTENCEPATGLWIEITAADKIKISWETPENSEGLSGYYVMRKTSEENEWKRVKVLGSNKNDYTDSGANAEGVWYAYKVIAYYQDIDCLSAPAKAKYGNEYFVKIMSPVGLEDNASQQLKLYPNPVDNNLKVEAKGIKNISIVNLMGQKVYESVVNADEVNLNMSDFQSGIYMIQVTTEEYTITERISVAH